MKKSMVVLFVFGLLGMVTAESRYTGIVLPEQAHPALRAAAGMVAQACGLPESAIRTGEVGGAGMLVFSTNPPPAKLKHDGYVVAFREGGATVFGARPRSFLFAAGEFGQWRDHGVGLWTRDPAFAVRTAAYRGRHTIPQLVAALGINGFIPRVNPALTFEQTMPEVFAALDPATQKRLRQSREKQLVQQAELVRSCREADISCYPLLYGNDLERWSSTLYKALIAVHPEAKGTPPAASWERASLCPSDTNTWRAIAAGVREFAEQGCDGVYATFWDHYGLDCQCDRCRAAGNAGFAAQLKGCVGSYRAALKPMDKELIVRTWSSGVPHWLGDTWVHAPGYDHFGGSADSVWGRVIRELPTDIVIQTKVYHADCQPDTRFSPFLGKAAPHPEIAEWQITGQTTGNFYFPASTVDHTAQTMKRSLALVGASGGVSVFLGATKQPQYELLDDIANSFNAYAWKAFSWDPAASVDAVWQTWAEPIYGKKAAPAIIAALRLSEPVATRVFSTLGMGSDTESRFAKTIARREVLLKYSNRYYLPEGRAMLEPTLENVARVVAEKAEVMRQIDGMDRQLALARPHLTPAQANELATRFGWLRSFAVVAGMLDESLWRFRYLRHEAAMLTTDPEQMKHLAAAYDMVEKQRRELFKIDPAATFSCWAVPVGQLEVKPGLGSPQPLMQEIYQTSLKFVQDSVGPDGLPREWLRPLR